MNRWVLLEHKVKNGDSIDIHFDFLVEDKLDCFTWKLLKIPLVNKEHVEIYRQPNHRLVWLSRSKYVLSRNRGMVRKIDYGNFKIVSLNKDDQDLHVILDGKVLNGLLEISGNICKLTKNY